MTTAELLRHIAEGRRSHLDWALSQEARRRAGLKPEWDRGSATLHRKWVRIYDELRKRITGEE